MNKSVGIKKNGMPLDKKADVEYLIAKQEQNAADMEFLAMCAGVSLEQEALCTSVEDFEEEVEE